MNEIILTSITKDALVSEITGIILNAIKENKSIPFPEKDNLSRKEVAAKFGVSEVTIHNWAKNGLLTKYKINGSTVIYKRSEVEKLLIKVEARKR